MPVSFFEESARGPEASALLAFAGNRIDRQSEYRDPECLARAFNDPRTRCYGFAARRLVLATNGVAPSPLLSLQSAEACVPDHGGAIVLGYDPDGAARMALPLGIMEEQLPSGFAMTTPRAVYADGGFDAATVGEIAQAASLINWSQSAQFCGTCGRKTVSEAGGYRRRCAPESGGCGALIFPRTDPVVIMLTIDEAGDRCLLGRSPHFPTGFYSCLAGFLEPGETMEDAVRRETLEEAGITIGRVRYHASQPWPIPHSIMIGFYAEAKSVDIDLDREELEDCRWVTRKEAARLLQRIPNELTTANDGTIANRLLRDWVGIG
ncbi:NAD(+) diphosphatase [Pararhizobium haloflavum]|uniref:NAD(+) diphosphatase n=1 Tax=Pararhizobium haloflavum TaxID=2037914 RepID=UPI000C17D058|nr:NAD(+) diphosphatase [Pararhizobium haloflavum]